VGQRFRATSEGVGRGPRVAGRRTPLVRRPRHGGAARSRRGRGTGGGAAASRSSSAARSWCPRSRRRPRPCRRLCRGPRPRTPGASRASVHAARHASGRDRARDRRRVDRVAAAFEEGQSAAHEARGRGEAVGHPGGVEQRSVVPGTCPGVRWARRACRPQPGPAGAAPRRQRAARGRTAGDEGRAHRALQPLTLDEVIARTQVVPEDDRGRGGRGCAASGGSRESQQDRGRRGGQGSAQAAGRGRSAARRWPARTTAARSIWPFFQ
jgi:hypothetical protein